MIANPKFLWENLLDRLEREGLLFHQSMKATPAEIAKHVRAKTGDNRVHRFVWSYYYPRTFGNEAGALSDLDAEALVESYNRPLTKQERTTMEQERKPASEVAPQPKNACRICGVRATMVEEASQ